MSSQYNCAEILRNKGMDPNSRVLRFWFHLRPYATASFSLWFSYVQRKIEGRGMCASSFDMEMLLCIRNHASLQGKQTLI